MHSDERNQQLLEFFKALADANRLKMVGLLAKEPHSVEQLASILGLDSSTVSHHLKRLGGVGLVEAKAQGYYSLYSLRTEVLQETARNLLGSETLPRLAEQVELEAFDRKVLQTYLGEDGQIHSFPAQQKKYLVLVRHVLQAFEWDKHYTEKQVNEVLHHYNKDTARLRRSLVDHGFMKREGGGGAYWRVQ